MFDVSVQGAIVNGIFGAAGMLVGGLLVYQRVEGLIRELKGEMAAMKAENSKELDVVWEKIADLQPREVCLAEKKTCAIQFEVFKSGQLEIKTMFAEMRKDLKDEMKMLRECISAATQGKC